jgi:hypothetical protein
MGLYNRVFFGRRVGISNIQNTLIKSNNINSLKIHDTTQNYRTLQKVFQRLSQHNSINSKYCHIQKLHQSK